MKPHQERVVKEKEELDVKREALSKFIQSPLFVTLDTEEAQRLNTQFHIMSSYSSILEERIQHFKE